MRSLSATQLTSQLAKHLPKFVSTQDFTAELDFAQADARDGFTSFSAAPAGSVLFVAGLTEFEQRQLLTLWHTGPMHRVSLQQPSDLFGRFDQNGKLQPGLLHAEDNSLLVFSASDLLRQPQLTCQLFDALLRSEFSALPADHRAPWQQISPEPIRCKLVILGRRFQLEQLLELSSQAPQVLRHFIELHNTMNFLSTPADKISEQLNSYLGWLQQQITCAAFAALQQDAVELLLKISSRICEHQQYLTLSFAQLKPWLTEAERIRQLDPAKPECIEAKHISAADQLFLRLRKQPSDHSLRAILSDQLVIHTSGERIGEINGLSVLESGDHSYGEPCRLSAIFHAGDGEISDIEDKADLAGSLHSKGVSILSAWLSAQFGHTDPLPLSASMTFEQSHDTIDGDSASVTMLCALLSSFSQIPLKQSLAITGAVDQLGNVMAVGGINDKIQAFYRVCEARQLTGKQGVLIPASNQQELLLPDDICQAVAENRFAIYPVATVQEAMALLTGKSVAECDDDGHYLPDTVFAAIERRLRTLREQEATPQLWQRIRMGIEDLLQRR